MQPLNRTVYLKLGGGLELFFISVYTRCASSSPWFHHRNLMIFELPPSAFASDLPRPADVKGDEWTREPLARGDDAFMPQTISRSRFL